MSRRAALSHRYHDRYFVAFAVRLPAATRLSACLCAVAARRVMLQNAAAWRNVPGGADKQRQSSGAGVHAKCPG